MPFDYSPVLSQQRFLPGRSTLQLDDAEGTVIAVESGCLWGKREKDGREVDQVPGVRFELDRRGRTIVAVEEVLLLGVLAPADCPEGSRAWMARKLAAVF